MMNDPHVGQRVWATGLKGTFAVTAVDRAQRTAHLEAIGTHKTEQDISFDLLNPLGGDISQSRFR